MKTTDLELAPRHEPPQAIAVRDPESILRYALEKGASVDVMERLLAVRRELKEEQSKELFDSALRDFQAECPVISKAKAVSDAGGNLLYAYAPLEVIIDRVKPLLQRHGFSFQLDTDVESKDGWVIAKCHVTHCAGHCRTSTAKFPLGAGTRLMSATQVYAAALTFASRRVFCNAFGIVTAGEDMDGQGAKPKPPGPSTKEPENPGVRALARALWQLLPAEVAGKNTDWTRAKQMLLDSDFITPEEHGGGAHAPQLTPERFRQVIEKVKNKAK